MDGLVEQLLRLEGAKHEALILIDAPAYDASVREQLRILTDITATTGVTKIEPLLALSQMITLNGRLLKNLLASTTLFDSIGYTAEGRLPALLASGRISVEA